MHRLCPHLGRVTASAGRSGENAGLFSFDGDPSIRTTACSGCGREHDFVTGFVLRDGEAYGVYYADWHPDGGDAYVDVILGSFEEPDYPDNVTFGCRIGHVASQPGPACSLVSAGATRPDHRLFGRKLEPGEARAHPRLREFWAVVDWLVMNDPLLHANVFHMPPREA